MTPENASMDIVTDAELLAVNERAEQKRLYDALAQAIGVLVLKRLGTRADSLVQTDVRVAPPLLLKRYVAWSRK